MRSRTVREGSVGLLLLLGAGLIVGLILWVRGWRIGDRSYTAVVEFPRVNGLQEGAAVRFRGVTVGQISAIRPRTNGVDVTIEVSPANLIIPRDVLVEANQSGFLGEVSVDITPQSRLPVKQVAAKPLESNCDRTLIVCDGSRLQGEIGVSTDELIRFSTRFADVYSNPKLYENVNSTLENTSKTAAEVAQLTRELTGLTKATRQQLNNFSSTVNQISASTTKTANQFGATADQIRLTAAQANRLITNLDNLVTTNRSSLVTSLNNLSQTSQQLRSTVSDLTPTLNRVSQGELLNNLETLTANAAQASANLRDVSNALNNPNNILVLQQTLDSARVTFQNAQKISSDLDDLTGDPAFRENLRDLVNGLSSLVSSTDQLQQQVEVAEALDSLTTAVNNTPKTKSGNLGAKDQVLPLISTKNSLKSASILQNSKSITQPMPESIARNQLLRRLLRTKTSSSGS